MKNHSLKNDRAKCLYKFLYKHNLFASYLKNVMEQNPCSKGVLEYLENKDFLKLLENTRNIDLSFIWSDTKEGDFFWGRMNHKEIAEKNKLLNELRLLGVKFP